MNPWDHATVYADRRGGKQVLGSDLDGHYIVVDLHVAPRFGKEVIISRDDFMLEDRQRRREDHAPRPQPDRRPRCTGNLADRRRRHAHSNGPTWGIGGATVGGAPEPEPRRPGENSGSKDKPSPMLKVLKTRNCPK